MNNIEYAWLFWRPSQTTFLFNENILFLLLRGPLSCKISRFRDRPLFNYMFNLVERTSADMSKVRRTDSLIHLTHILTLHHTMKLIWNRPLSMNLHDSNFSMSSSPWKMCVWLQEGDLVMFMSICWWNCHCTIGATQSMVYEWLHLNINNHWGCKGKAIVVIEVSVSHKEMIVCQFWNFMLLNCPTRRELIYIINVATQFPC